MKLGPVEVGGNVWCLGPFYVAATRTTTGKGFPVQCAWVNEPEPPFRYGRGLGLRLPRCFAQIGFWRRQDVEDLAARWHAEVACSSDIQSWMNWDEEVERGLLLQEAFSTEVEHNQGAPEGCSQAADAGPVERSA